MHAFRDTAGRTWQLSVTFGSAKRVKALLGINLLELEGGDPPLLTRLGTDVMLLCDVIFALIKPQADALGVSDEQWAEAMGGDAILAAQTALYEELTDFFQSRGRRDVATAIEKQRRLVDVAVRVAESRIEALDPQREVESIFGDSATSSPESPG